MGPYSTVDLYQWILRSTPAKRDQEHLPVVINSIPQIPDRSDFILNGGKDPKPYLISAVGELERIGVELIAIPCNTSHAFVEPIKKTLKKAELVDMIAETRNYLKKTLGGGRMKIGLLATTGTVEAGIYQDYFKDYHFVLLSNEEQHNLVTKAIYGERGIKAGYLKPNRRLLRKAVDILVRKGAEAVIFGCTEVALAFKNEKNGKVLHINPTKILAQVLVKKALIS